MAVDATSPNAHGFTLVELLLAAALGLVLFAVSCRLLLGEARHGGALAQHLLLRTSQRRTLALIKLDLHRADSWTLTPDAAGPWPCPIGARQPLIAIHMRDNDLFPLCWLILPRFDLYFVSLQSWCRCDSNEPLKHAACLFERFRG